MTIVRVKSVVQNIIEKTDGESRPFLGLEDIESRTGRLLVEAPPFKAAGDSISHAPGDVLFSKLRPYLAKSYLPSVHGTGTGELLVLRPGPKLEKKFLLYVTLSAPWVDWANTSAYGSKMPRTSWELVANYRMWLPPLEEQRRIANFLDVETARIDKLSSLQAAVLARLDEREAAIIDLAIDDLVGRVGTTPFRRYITRMDQGASPQCDAVPAGDGDWGVLKVSCLRPGSFLPEQNKRLPEEIIPDHRSEIREGDLLITRANTPLLVGSTAVVPEVRGRLLLSDKIFRVGINSSLDPHYIALIARGSRVRAMCTASSNGASQSMANIRFEEVKEWPIPAIPREEQRRMVAEIDISRAQTDALRTRIVRQLDLLAERRLALITAAVTGQFDTSSASGLEADTP
jgi:type I restriction enzyme S subunit